MRNREFVLAQALEPRCLLSSAILNISGVLTITGDAGSNDTISISIDATAKNNLLVKVNANADRNFDKANVTSVIVNTLSGDDTITVIETSGLMPSKLTVRAGDGNDTITGGSESDYLYGDRGNDVVNSGEGKGFVHGGDGDDTLSGGASRDFFWGDSGADTIDGKNGKNVIRGGDGNDTILGGGHSDVIDGGTGHDSILGGGGNDILIGRDGNDTIRGNAGNDSIWGMNGADDLRGDDGDDLIWGGANTDVINVGRGTKNKLHAGEDPQIADVLAAIDSITK